MNVVVRRWTAEDLSAIPVVIWETWMDAYSSFIPEHDLKTYYGTFYTPANLKSLFDDANVNGFVAVEEERVVGFIRTRYEPREQRQYVSSLYILPGHQHKGIGSQLMRFAADEARARGLDRVWIGVMVQNIAGLAWYKKFGYQIHEEQPFAMGATTVNHYIGFVMLDGIDPTNKK